MLAGPMATLAVAASAQTPDDNAGAAARWYGIHAADGTMIGHGWRRIDNGPDGQEIVDGRLIALTESHHGGVKIDQRTVMRTNPAGAVVSMTDDNRVNGNTTRLHAVFKGNEARITRETAAERRTVTLPLPADIRFDMGDGLLKRWTPSSSAPLVFMSFNLPAMAVERVVIEAPHGDHADADGHVVLLRKRYDGDQLRGIARLRVDRDRNLVDMTQPMFSTIVSVRPVPRAVALQPRPVPKIDLELQIKSPFRIPAPALNGQIRYSFGFRDGIRFALPETGEQRAAPSSDDPETVTVDICTDCGPDLPSDPAALADALKPTPWLQSDSGRIRAIAAPIARAPVSDARKMALLAAKARTLLERTDFTGHYSALEAIRRGVGDCTEDAVVLAALGRAAGIPTKVVNGIVYTRQLYHGVSNAFMPHSWTLAWVDGRWRSFDMSLDTFDSSHIALTIGDGDQRAVTAASQLASLLEWKGMAQVKTAAPTETAH